MMTSKSRIFCYFSVVLINPPSVETFMRKSFMHSSLTKLVFIFQLKYEKQKSKFH